MLRLSLYASQKSLMIGPNVAETMILLSLGEVNAPWGTKDLYVQSSLNTVADAECVTPRVSKICLTSTCLIDGKKSLMSRLITTACPLCTSAILGTERPRSNPQI